MVILVLVNKIMENKQLIKCDVKTCKFNNTDDELCNLNIIKVSTINNDCHNKKETKCNSFEYK